jgi:ABC-type transport system involved in multi-copper enzyme maturation permease subunit
MLLYKAWRESRSRFLVGLPALAGYCFIMALQKSDGGPFSDRVFSGSLFFELLVIVLGVGGLLRERAQHTAVFTLTLPVNRLQLVGGHVTVGLVETVVLALVPALMAGPLAALTHQTVLAEDVMRYCLLRILCGGFIFAVSFLISVLFPGAYMAPVACFIVLFMEGRIAWWAPPLRPYLLIPQATMNGHWGYEGIGSIRDPLPTAGLLIMVLMTIAPLLAATRITQKEDL